MQPFIIEAPTWAQELYNSNKGKVFANESERIELSIEISKINVESKSGGPFGAAIFDSTNRLVGIGANFVLASKTSLAHAECVAIGFTQQHLGTHDLSSVGKHSMYCSAQPCIMCFGALWWSGISELVYAAHSKDVETLAGFIEGPLPKEWEAKLGNREPLPSLVVRQASSEHREAAKTVLADYKNSGAQVYNAGS